MTREITILDHEALITLGTERRRLKPWGLLGGKHGGSSDCWIVTPKGEKEGLPSKVTIRLEPGTRIVLKTSGGGGFGSAWDRDPEAVCHDVEEGLVSVGRAKEEYGVVIGTRPTRIDEEATRRLRERGVTGEGEESLDS